MLNLLDSIQSPADIRELPKSKLPDLAQEVRSLIIDTVAEKGGHFGAGLGATDLTVALHYCLNTPHDFLTWDVGHQVQAHKILTGRKEGFRKTFRQYRGVSGLANKDEGPYDPFTTGHAGTSISSGLGVAVSRRLQNKGHKTVVVIGDASIASGMCFEALNQAGHLDENLVVVLNDNEMSISPSVGALSRYFNRVLTNPLYNRIRKGAANIMTSVPKVGKQMAHKVRQIEEGIRHLFVPGILFEGLGFRYFGPIDGHNITEMVDLFPKIFKMKGPSLIHVITKKGKGYELAEENPRKWHASTPFHVATGTLKKNSKPLDYTKVFGRALVELAEKNPKITALTGGMTDGTGLQGFSEKFPDRFFDVGIAEEHGVTFCAGLAHGGMRPVAAIYSTFLQRAHDQILHDVALQNLPVMFCLDRAGLVGEDGPTHHGAFDIAYLRKVPGMVSMEPRDSKELVEMLGFMVNHLDGPISVRYPRGTVAEVEFPMLATFPRSAVELGKSEVLTEGSDVLFLALGQMVGRALKAAEILAQENISSTVVNARFIKPLDDALILKLAKAHQVILTLEEGTVVGGYGSGVLELLANQQIEFEKVACLGLPDEFVEAGPKPILLANLGLDPERIADRARGELRNRSKVAQTNSDRLQLFLEK